VGVLELVIVLVALYAVFAIMLPFLRPGRLLAGIARLVAAWRPTGSLTMTTCRSCELSPEKCHMSLSTRLFRSSSRTSQLCSTNSAVSRNGQQVEYLRREPR